MISVNLSRSRHGRLLGCGLFLLLTTPLYAQEWMPHAGQLTQDPLYFTGRNLSLKMP